MAPHFDSLVTDDAFMSREGGTRLDALPSPTKREVEWLLRWCASRAMDPCWALFNRTTHLQAQLDWSWWGRLATHSLGGPLSNLTIRMMVKLGPWMFCGIHDKGFNKSQWEHCEIEDCGEHIRYVHVVQREDDPKEWRIGSTCGPKLIQLSDEAWSQIAKEWRIGSTHGPEVSPISEKVWGHIAAEADRNLELLLRAERINELESGPNAIMAKHLGANWVDAIIAVLKSGKTDGRTLEFKSDKPVDDLKIIQVRLGRAEKIYKLKPYRRGAGK